MTRSYYTYKITHPTNGKVYIGSTSRHPSIRWKQHKAQMRQGKVSPLYTAMRQTRFWTFTMEIVGVHATREAMLREETKLMIQYHSFVPSGYNRIASSNCFALQLHRMSFPYRRIVPAAGVRHRVME